MKRYLSVLVIALALHACSCSDSQPKPATMPEVATSMDHDQVIMDHDQVIETVKIRAMPWWEVRANYIVEHEFAGVGVPDSQEGVDELLRFVEPFYISRKELSWGAVSPVMDAAYPKMVAYLRALDNLANSDRAWISNPPIMQDFERTAMLDVLGFVPELSRNNFQQLWYRTLVGFWDYNIVNGSIEGSGLNKSDAIRVLVGGKLLPGLDDPEVCIKRVQAYHMASLKPDAPAPTWQDQEYNLALQAHMRSMQYRNPRKYFLWLQRYFPAQDGSVSDWVIPTLIDVAMSNELTKQEKLRFFEITNSRMKACYSERDFGEDSGFDFPFQLEDFERMTD